MCSFKINNLEFGELQYFVLTPQPVAVMKVIESSGSSILEQAGNPCRQQLNDYKEMKLLRMFMHEIKLPKGHFHLALVPISNIKGKAIHIQLNNSNFDYILEQLNAYEHN